jgi:D-3-phosphoglycerate dehydrogenase
VELLGALGPYVVLAEKLGLFLAQIVDGAMERIRVIWWGSAPPAEGMALVTSGFLKGFFAPSLSSRVNLVNARSVAAERGIRVSSSTSSESLDYTNLVTVEVEGPEGTHKVEGALFGRMKPRLVRLDDYRLDAVPKGNMILIYNDDVPGVIGAVGTCLGRHGINIAGLYNGRKQAGEEALSLVNVDEPPDEKALADLRALPHVRSVRAISAG